MVKTPHNNWKNSVHKQFEQLHDNALQSELVSERELYEALAQHSLCHHDDAVEEQSPDDTCRQMLIFSCIVILCLAVGASMARSLVEHVMGVRCFMPNNYLIWEATRPISDCTFCSGVTKPRILSNVMREEFMVR